jgi:hypothetical protein
VHFLLNLLIAWRVQPEELFAAYLEKAAKNRRRQELGYTAARQAEAAAGAHIRAQETAQEGPGSNAVGQVPNPPREHFQSTTGPM